MPKINSSTVSVTAKSAEYSLPWTVKLMVEQPISGTLVRFAAYRSLVGGDNSIPDGSRRFPTTDRSHPVSSKALYCLPLQWTVR